MFVLKKKVDWSLLTDGFSIPVAFQTIVHSCYPEPIKPGETRPVKIVIGAESYDAKLVNGNFSRTTYRGHVDILQVRYSKGTPLAKKLQSIFSESYQFLKTQRELNKGVKRHISVPDDMLEYISFSTTDLQDVFVVECFPVAENNQLRQDVESLNEYDFESETFEPKCDDTAGIVEVNRIQRVRKLNRSITDSLKVLYDYRCQITGEKIGDKYDCNVIEAHHIEYFTKSLNNDTSNIIIVNPNFHRIIHSASPRFDATRLAFVFPNGVVEKVRLNKHL